ncbi:unnamed protein product [Brassicogethes aeneus]|uniref:PDZ domain-containing protein n=1 Tax=Brassicogethes aeneus TaxID=1431903 RepID=A0A9P0FBD3_BRAAE|nr:unnamed protein product [Brassicogethes aeneus]
MENSTPPALPERRDFNTCVTTFSKNLLLYHLVWLEPAALSWCIPLKDTIDLSKKLKIDWTTPNNFTASVEANAACITTRNPVGPSLNGGGSHARRPSPGPGPPASPGGGVHRPTSLMDTPPPSAGGPISYPMVQVVVNKDDKGYGMKVTGDNPVYVQSVKEGGPAEKAGLHAGDKIIKVNGINVRSSTHTEVVNLIRAQTQVILTVQQRTFARLSQGSPSMHNRQSITNPQPVDNEKQSQLQRDKENYYRLMIEKEKNYVDTLRSKIAVSPDEKKIAELAKTEKNIETLEACLYKSLNEQSISSPSPSHSPIKYGNIPTTPNGNSGEPPPLPKRNLNMNKKKKGHHFNTIPSVSQCRSSQREVTSTPTSPIDLNMTFMQNEINANRTPTFGRRSMPYSRSSEPPREQPPPLPPRSTNPSSPLDPDAVNSINKQMSYPLVAFTSVLNQHSPNGPTHHRTKSSPESLSDLGGGATSGRLTTSESMNDLSRQDGNWERAPDTPPGTPPPPYPSPPTLRKDRSQDDGFILAEVGSGGLKVFIVTLLCLKF